MARHVFQIFSGIPATVQDNLLAHLPVRVFPRGSVLLREGEANDQVFLIGAGELAVWKGEPETPQGVRIATLAPGDHLWIARGQKHWVTWTAKDRPSVWLAVHFD